MDVGQTVAHILDEAERIANTVEFDDVDSVEEALEVANMPSAVLSTGDEFDQQERPQKMKKRSWKKPADKPKRPLSAYNLFFQLERERIISGKDEREVTPEDVANISIQHQQKKPKRRHRKTHGKISFADLARTIATKWRNLDDSCKGIFEQRAESEKERYRVELEEWSRKQVKTKEQKIPKMRDVVFPPQTACVDVKSMYGMTPTGSSLMPGLIQQEMTPSSDSLDALFSHGQNYTRVHNLAETSRIDQMQAAMNYGRNVYTQPAATNPYQTYMPYPDQSDYYDMAEQAYNMAQMTLGLQQRRYNSQVGVSGGAQFSAVRSRRFYEPEHHSYYDSHHATALELSMRDRMMQTHLMQQEEVALDPHQGLSSPTFDSSREELFIDTFDSMH